MAVLPFLVMDTLQAARLRELTQNSVHKLDALLIDAGVHKGKWALPKRIMLDPAYEMHYDAFSLLTEVAFDPEVAWPPVEED